MSTRDERLLNTKYVPVYCYHCTVVAMSGAWCRAHHILTHAWVLVTNTGQEKGINMSADVRHSTSEYVTKHYQKYFPNYPWHSFKRGIRNVHESLNNPNNNKSLKAKLDVVTLKIIEHDCQQFLWLLQYDHLLHSWLNYHHHHHGDQWVPCDGCWWWRS